MALTEDSRILSIFTCDQCKAIASEQNKHDTTASITHTINNFSVAYVIKTTITPTNRGITGREKMTDRVD